MINSKKQFCKYGHDTLVCGKRKNGRCILCEKVYDSNHKEEHKIHYQNNKDKKQEDNRLYYQENKERLMDRKKRNYRDNVELMRVIKQVWRDANQDKLREYYKKYYKDNSEMFLLAHLKCETNRNFRVVNFGQDGIDEFYHNKLNGMTVDHIIPLQGDLVSGLHVSWNLQYLTRSQNSSKNNKCNLLETSELYGKILEKVGLK